MFSTKVRWELCQFLRNTKITRGSVRLISSAVHETDTNKEAQSSVEADDYNLAKPFHEIPGPKGLPLIGNWLDYKRHPWKIHQRHIYIQQLKEEYGDIVLESFAGNTVLHLLSPEHVKKVYQTEGKYPMVPPLLPTVASYRKNNKMSQGLGNTNGEEWYNLRRIAQQVLVRPQKAFDYLYLENEVVDDFMKLLPSLIEENGEVKNLKTWLLRWGIECSFYTFLEKRMGYFTPAKWAEADELISRSNEVFTQSTKLWFGLKLYKYFLSPTFNRFYECEDYVTQYMKRALREAVDEYTDQVEGKTNTEKQYLFLSYMLSRYKVPWEDVVAINLSVLTDNLSTTVVTLMFCLYTLAANPEAQEKAYQEAVSVLSANGDLTIKGFNSSSYIKACMKETFRFFPIGLDVQRLAPCDMVIGGYQVPKDTYICIENWVPLQDPEYIPEPNKFNPDRWLRANSASKEQENPYILLPFSIGTRMCVGRRFAEQELVMMMARILKDYKLEWHHKPLDQRYQLLQVPDGELKIKFIPRNT